MYDVVNKVFKTTWNEHKVVREWVGVAVSFNIFQSSRNRLYNKIQLEQRAKTKYKRAK